MYNIFGEQVPLGMLVAYLAVAGCCVLALRLRAILLLTLVALFLPQLYIPIHGFGTVARLLRWVLLVALVTKGLGRNLRHGLRPVRGTAEHRVLFAFVVLIGVSAAWSIGPEITLLQGFVLALLWLGIYVVLWNSWDSEDSIPELCQTLFTLAALVFTLEGIYQILGVGIVTGKLGRHGGVFLNPNGMGATVAFLGPFVYWKHRTTTSAAVKWYARALGFVMVVGLIQSGSRTGLLGSVICMGTILSYVHRARIAIALSIVIPPLLLLLVFAPSLDTQLIERNAWTERVIRPDTLANLSDRLPLWEEAFELFEQRPILGYGFAMNKFAGTGRADLDLARAILKLGNLNYHNTYLELLVDLGLVGLVPFVLFLLFTLRRGFGIFRRAEHSARDLAGIAFFGAFLAMFGDTFVHGWAFSPGSTMAIVFWLVSAAVIHVQSVPVEREEETEVPEEETAESPGAEYVAG